MTVLNTTLSQYKSSLYETCRTLINSRSKKADQVGQLSSEIERLRRLNDRLALDLKNARDAAEENRQLYEKQLLENQQLRERPIRLPSDLPVPGHTYGVKFICLCVNIAKRIGFRAASASLKIMFDFLGIRDKIPSHDSIRTWACRIGVAIIEEEEQTGEGEM